MLLVGFGAQLAQTAGAQSVPQPEIDVLSNGNYVVSYTPCSGCYADGLEEFRDQTGTWEYAGSAALEVYNRSPGNYRYRVVYVVPFGRSGYQPVYGPEASVIVYTDSEAEFLARRPTLPIQWEADYLVSTGDVDADGNAELLIRRSSAVPESADGTLGNVLLRRSAAGSLEASIPDAQQLAIASGWISAPVRIEKRDINIDGYLDLVLLGVDETPGFAATSNQILFAPGSLGFGQPPTVLSVDDSLASFSADIDRHLIDPEYYLNNVPVNYAWLVYYQLDCGWSGYDFTVEGFYPWSCSVHPRYLYVVYRDYSVFNRNAMEIADIDYGMIHGFETPESGMERIATSLSGILGVQVGGWDVNELLGQNAAMEDETDRQGLGLFAVLAGISEAVAQVREEEAATAVTERVELKGRRVLGQGPFHTILEFGNSTVSAYDSDPRAFFDGTLVSQVNWPRDHPSLTLQMGYVDGPTLPANYWNSVLLADSRYDDDLPYDLFPSIGAGGYNSNSFTSGLIQATLGTPTISMQTFVGGELPVPATAFN
jgi:hypothetical protein